MRKNIKLLVLILVGLTLVACRCEMESATDSAIDRGLLYGEPCAPPCWEGITPGVSSKEDVLRILDQLESDGGIESYTVWNFRAEGRFGTVYIGFDDDEHVDGIRLHPWFDYRVKQVIDQFGEPEAYASPSRLEREDCPCQNWDDEIYERAPSGGGYLLYPSQGVTVRIRIAEGYTGCVCSEMETAVLYYYVPRSLADALEEGRTPAFDWADWSSADLVQWHGYGSGY
jgi:hypothetical protein